MGVSDRYHFDWLTSSLARFEAEQGALAAIARQPQAPVMWCLAEERETPPIASLRSALGGTRSRATFFDGFSNLPGVERQDLNALENLPEAGCDVLTLLRASMFITDPARTLGGIHRVLRPGGLAVIDWLHGTSDAPVLDLNTDPRYGGASTPYRTTYCDEIFLREFRGEFGELVRHVNRPPVWVNVEEPGKRVPWGERTRRALKARPRSHVTVEGYMEAARAALERAGKHLIGPELMEQHFKVRFRSARYFYRNVRRFNLFLLTVLSPVGK